MTANANGSESFNYNGSFPLFGIAHKARLRAASERSTGDASVAVVFAVATLDAYLKELLHLGRMTIRSNYSDEELKEGWPEGDQLRVPMRRFIRLVDMDGRRSPVLRVLSCLSDTFRSDALDVESGSYKNVDALLAFRNWVVHRRPERVVGTTFDVDEAGELHVEYGESSYEVLLKSLRDADAFPKHPAPVHVKNAAPLKTLTSFDTTHPDIAAWACDTAALVGRWTVSAIPGTAGPMGARLLGFQFWRGYTTESVTPHGGDGIYDQLTPYVM